ncbi:MAG: M28 family peptidase [Acidobacteriota bacterium]
MTLCNGLKSSFLGATLFLLSACGERGVSPAEAVELITKEGILRDIQALSSDDMEGRGTATAGEEKAARYIQERFQSLGLAPLGDSYFQWVDLVGTKKVSDRSSLTLGKGKSELKVQPEQTLTYWSTSQKPVVEVRQAPLLFVGYGVEAPEYQWDDFKGADVSGKVLLFLNDDPPVSENGVDLFGGEARTYYGRWTYKFEQAMRHGAAGAFMIHTTPSASYPFSVVQHNGSEENFALDLPGSGYQVDLLGWMDEATSREIAKAMGSSLEGLFQMGASRDFKPVDTGFRVTAHIETEIRRVRTRNVLGLLEGSDPELKEQVVVFSAHYDHLGRSEALSGDDKIYNGAWDNASGTACIINLATSFAALRPLPRRSILFLACGAEESGSLGSRWFVAKPPFELSRLVADINIDMTQIFGVTSDLAAIGVQTNTLGDTLRHVAGQFNVPGQGGQPRAVVVTGDPDPRAGSFYRSDQVNFAKAGIPALFIHPGTHYVEPLSVDPEAYREAHYHQVSDQVDEAWNLSGAERDMRIVFQSALQVANADQMPRWAPGNEFEGKWKQLHGKPR